MISLEIINEIDTECLPLVKALNNIPGIHTTESCCGHNNEAFIIFACAVDIASLYILGRHFDRNYCTAGWTVRLVVNDKVEDIIHRVSFMVHRLASPTTYQESYTIARAINSFLNNDAFMEMINE